MAMRWKSIRKALDSEAILERMGLERRTPAGDFFTGLGLFSVGVLVGAGLGLMFAPKRGNEMRAMLNEALRSRARAAQELHPEMTTETSPPLAPPPGVMGH
jgi:hypothetical protein